MKFLDSHKVAHDFGKPLISKSLNFFNWKTWEILSKVPPIEYLFRIQIPGLHERYVESEAL